MALGTKLRALATACAIVALVGGCKGGGGDTGGTNPPPTNTTPPPPPPPPPAPTGAVAAVAEGTIPDLGTNDMVGEFQVTNRGLYMSVRDADEVRPDRVVKLHGSPAFSNAWTTATPDSRSDSLLLSFAPSNIYSEADRAVSFYWASSVATVSQRWGHYTMNTGGISIQAEEPFRVGERMGQIRAVAAGTLNGIIGPRPWIVTSPVFADDGYRVFQDDGAYTASNTITDRFSRAATPSLDGGPSVAVSHPTDPHLYIGHGNRLLVYNADKLVKSFTLPGSGMGQFSDLIWVQGDLYVGFDGRVWRLPAGSDTISSIVSHGLPLDIPGSFCVSAGEIFLTTGQAVNIQTKASRNWISKGTLTAAQSSQAAILQASLGGGIHCSATSLSPAIYSYFAATKKLRVISPVS